MAKLAERNLLDEHGLFFVLRLYLESGGILRRDRRLDAPRMDRIAHSQHPSYVCMMESVGSLQAILPAISIRSCLGALLIAAAPFAHALADSLDQYPSFIEYTTADNAGTQVTMRCGYSSRDGKTVSLDPSYLEISTSNEKKNNRYSRLQRIDDVLIATEIAPVGKTGLVLQLIKPDGSVVARNCQTNTNDDTISDCKPNNPFTKPDQVKAEGRRMNTLCQSLIENTRAQINPRRASPQQTEETKARLRQKVATLSAE